MKGSKQSEAVPHKQGYYLSAISHHISSLVSFSRSQGLERLDNMGRSCDAERAMTVLKALMADKNILLFSLSSFGITSRRLHINELYNGTPDLEARVGAL